MLSLPVVIALIAESGEINAPYELMIRHKIWGLVALSSLFGCGLGLGTSALYKYFAPRHCHGLQQYWKVYQCNLGMHLF